MLGKRICKPVMVWIRGRCKGLVFILILSLIFPLMNAYGVEDTLITIEESEGLLEGVDEYLLASDPLLIGAFRLGLLESIYKEFLETRDFVFEAVMMGVSRGRFKCQLDQYSHVFNFVVARAYADYLNDLSKNKYYFKMDEDRDQKIEGNYYAKINGNLKDSRLAEVRLLGKIAGRDLVERKNFLKMSKVVHQYMNYFKHEFCGKFRKCHKKLLPNDFYYIMYCDEDCE